MADLKPCPHCGGEAEMDTMQAFRVISDGRISHAVAVYCLSCSAGMTACYADHSGLELDDLIHMLSEQWNRRINETREPDTRGEASTPDY